MTLQVKDTLSSSGYSDEWIAPYERDFNITLRGTWTGSVTIERGFKDDVDGSGDQRWQPMTFGGEEFVYTANMSESFGEAERHVKWRLAFTWSSGDLEYYVSGQMGGRP